LISFVKMTNLYRSVPYMVSLLLLSLLSKSSNKIFAFRLGGNNGNDSARRKSPVHTASQVTKPFSNDDHHGSGASDHQIAQRQRDRRLNAVAFVSVANVFINSFRPDESITWQVGNPHPHSGDFSCFA